MSPVATGIAGNPGLPGAKGNALTDKGFCKRICTGHISYFNSQSYFAKFNYISVSSLNESHLCICIPTHTNQTILKDDI